MVFFEAPPHSRDPAAMVEAFGAGRPAAVCREMTKTYEEVRRGPLGELADWAANGVLSEITIVVAGASLVRRPAHRGGGRCGRWWERHTAQGRVRAGRRGDGVVQEGSL